MSTGGTGQPLIPLQINLGGEGEEPDCLNQQPFWLDLAVYVQSRTGISLQIVLNRGDQPYVFCDNRYLPFSSDYFNAVLTNGVPVDKITLWGPGVQSSEIRRVLRSGGEWIHDGIPVYRKP